MDNLLNSTLTGDQIALAVQGQDGNIKITPPVAAPLNLPPHNHQPNLQEEDGVGDDGTRDR